jgi:hypothetical protein
MYEFHGWVNVVADDSDEPESFVLQARQDELVAALDGRLQALRASPFLFVHIARDLNREAHLLISGCHNHRDDRVLDLFRWVAEHQPCSYGLLHIRDDEDANGYENAFVVHAIRCGELVSAVESNLSPCMPLLERPWQPASHQGSARDDSRDEQLRRILAIGHDTSGRGDGISLREALNRARYRECRTGLQEADLLRVIEAEPELVDQWLAYSEDKRTEGGWYVLRSGEVGKVTKPSSRIQFGTIEQAVAAYVIRELDFWAGVGNGR